MSILLESLDHEVASITRDAERALVRIGNAGEGFGAGAIVQADGLIVTNAHVLRRDDVTVTLADGRTFRGTVLARDRQRDLAAVSIPVSGLPILPIGDSATMRSGQWVLALGHPWGVEGAACAGVVTGRNGSLDDTYGWLAVALPLRPGNSGGPLVDAQGQLIGLAAMMSGPRSGLAVPAQAIKQFLRRHLASEMPAAATVST